jgi:hypothetical protein
MKNVFISYFIVVMLFVVFIPSVTSAQQQNEILVTVAEKLVNSQSSNGSWLGEEGYTGSITAGLVQAYEITENDPYITAAKHGVQYILKASGGNFYGDEAFALARYAEVTGDQEYKDVVCDFYNNLDTNGYLLGYAQTDLSTAVFYVAQHTVAAYMVEAADAGIWRESLIGLLSQVDDTAIFPVMSLGVATWALAQTGPMDDTKIGSPDLGGLDYWIDVTLSDLPSILANHQVLSGDHAGSFYVRFDHASPGDGFEQSGYTEDTIYGILGLVAADGLMISDETELDFDVEIQTARDVLSMSATDGGYVYEHIWSGSRTFYTFGGELLQAISDK